MFDFLPSRIQVALKSIDFNYLFELRIRAGCPIIICYKGRNCYLSQTGATENRFLSLFITRSEIETIIFNLCEKSIYAYADRLCQGYISVCDGIRVGVCGECVISEGRVKNVKNISSINVRIPHRVEGCSDLIFKYYNGEVKNTLIISPPGVGKTTIARDLVENISLKLQKNVLVVDERGEIYPFIKNKDFVDVIYFSPKRFAFENGIRAMAPEVIVTDEIFGDEDELSLRQASFCGVKIIATIHGSDCTFLNEMEYMEMKKYIELYVILSDEIKKGTIKQIYNKNLEAIYNA